MSPRTLGEDVEYQASSCQHTARKRLLKVAFLARAQCVIKNDQLGLVLIARGQDFLKFAFTDKGARMRRGTRAGDRGDRQSARRCHQFFEFMQTEIAALTGKLQLHEHSALTALMTLKKHGKSGALQNGSAIVSLQPAPRRPRRAVGHYVPGPQ